MEQNNMNVTLTYSQVESILGFLKLELRKELVEKYPDIDKYELDAFLIRVVLIKARAILCTLNSASYEDIVKLVRDKLKLDDLFDNRKQYLN